MTEKSTLSAIAALVPQGSRVLDLGCGDGRLLRYLRETKGVVGYGVEIDHERVLGCIRNDIDVIQIDIERGLSGFEDHSFDHVIISQALQAMRATERILSEMLRVSAEAVVSFPNFAYRANREAIAGGHMPVSEDLPYEWYDTPNVRFFTIADFDALCEQEGILIRERLAFDEDKVIVDEPNFLASVALYRLGRAGG